MCSGCDFLFLGFISGATRYLGCATSAKTCSPPKSISSTCFPIATRPNYSRCRTAELNWVARAIPSSENDWCSRLLLIPASIEGRRMQRSRVPENCPPNSRTAAQINHSGMYFVASHQDRNHPPEKRHLSAAHFRSSVLVPSKGQSAVHCSCRRCGRLGKGLLFTCDLSERRYVSTLLYLKETAVPRGCQSCGWRVNESRRQCQGEAHQVHSSRH